MSNKLPLNPSKWWILRLNIDRVNRRSKLTPKTCFDIYGNGLIFLLITVDNTNFLLSLAKFYLFKKEKIQFFSDESLMDSSFLLLEEQAGGRIYLHFKQISKSTEPQ